MEQKRAGGLGIVKVQDMNCSLLGKVWRRFGEENVLWWHGVWEMEGWRKVSKENESSVWRRERGEEWRRVSG